MEAFDVKVDLELLDVGQQTELIDLTGRIRYSEKSKPPPASPRAELERFVKRVESLTEEARGPNQKANLGLLADRARSTGRVPNRDEKKTILDNKDMAATIGSLQLPNHDPQVVARLLRGPAIRLREVLAIASRRPTSDPIVREISGSLRWMARIEVREALVANPFVRPRIALMLLPTLLAPARRALSRGSVHPLVRRAAIELA